MSERRLALVTGGARRVGRAIALELARAGCDVLITYNASESEARSASAEIERVGVRARAEALDLNDLERVERFSERLAKELPRVDVLVHNASIYFPTPLASLSPRSAEDFMHVNALAPLVLSRALAPRLAERGRGSIVAMVDMHALGRPRVGMSAYAMSKAALVEMVRSLARELAPAVRVNGVAPGVVAWPESGYEADRAMQQRYLQRVPMGRAGTPEDAAGAVRWLALDAPYVTGEIVRVDGGRWLA
ncbi:MAG: SDR family oxidoreductase [Planctomycetota bacterium]|nr:SDR family oxidoreductase [Planctomycetota bacterium]